MLSKAAIMNNFAVAHFNFTRHHQSYRFRVGYMLLLKNARREGAFIIIFPHGNRLLQHDGPMVKMLVNKVHGTAGDLYTIVERLLLRREPRKSRQK
jgi:hypothetical protein